MRAEDCYGRHPARSLNCPVRRPPDYGQRRGFFSEDDMKNTTMVLVAAGAVLVAVIVTRTPAQGGGEDSQPSSSQVAPASMQEQESVPCPWDCGDGDGNVGIVDFLALLALWGIADPCDIDNDGVVGITDFLALLANWGPCP